MNRFSGKRLFLAALILGVLFHGVLVFFTFEKTYDAFVHIFFGSHYAESWFDHWEYRWYTGFTMTSYPPLIHQLIAIFSYIIGLKGGFIVVSMLSTMVFVRGVYVFSKLWVDERTAGLASLLAIVSSSYVEAIHIFGQLPSATGIGILLNVTPHIYQWIRKRSLWNLAISLSFLAVITSVHHVTTIFGMVFFVFPVIGLAIMDDAIESRGDSDQVRLSHFLIHLWKVVQPALMLGAGTLVVIVFAILPYWIWSSSDPITQVPIPHGSRDSFIEVFSSGLVFFLIPWGMMLFVLPYLLRRIFTKRTIILAVSFIACLILGTGGTTPIPRALLGENAFNILTLDRFTYWATVMAIPFFALFISDLFQGSYALFIRKKFGKVALKSTQAFWVVGIVLTTLFIINIHYFKPLQPDSIEIQPIVNFLERDEHDRWRYLTLGFGDQVAWLGANTKALSVDGNYHSARRLPELTTRKVERLENAKYQGTEGIAALHQFLTIPEKYNLKYIFSNDKFYDPILHFSGWQRLRSLENNIEIWEKPDIEPLPSLLPRKDIPRYQQLMWSIIPMASLCTLLLIIILYNWKAKNDTNQIPIPSIRGTALGFHLDFGWHWLLLLFICGNIFYHSRVNLSQYSPENLVTAYFNAMDFKYFDEAFNLYDPAYAPSIDQMLLDLSQEDAITLSFAKLQNLDLQTTYLTDESASVKVEAEWITSISSYYTYHEFEAHLKGSKWWLRFNERDLSSPADQIFSSPDVNFRNQGRRNVSAPETAHADILDRPLIYISEANLVRKDKQYHIVGKLTNVDNDPAYITIQAILYDTADNEIVRYNAREVCIHNLLPKEETLFRVDFEDIATQKAKMTLPKVYDPTLSHPFEFLEAPSTFVLNIKSVVSTADMYKHAAISDVIASPEYLSGEFVNAGTQEINIPQLLVGYVRSFDNQLIWVQNFFMENAVRPQRIKYFSFNHPDLSRLELLEKGSDNRLFVNGQKSSNFNQNWINITQNSKENLYPFDSIYLVDIFPSGFVAQ